MNRVLKIFSRSSQINQIANNNETETNEISHSRDLHETIAKNTSAAAAALVGVLIFIVIFSHTGHLFSVIIATAYPTYNSIVALDSKNEEQKKWLRYWVIYGLFNFIDPFLRFFVGGFSLYWFLKCIFFVWLMLPNNYSGLLFLYNKLALPFYLEILNVLQETEDE